MFLVKDRAYLFHFRPLLLQSNNPQNPPENKINWKTFCNLWNSFPKATKTTISFFFEKQKLF